MINSMNYGSLIRKARKYRNWTLQDLADELSYQGIEIDTGNLSRIETGKQGTSNVVLDGILRTFGISIEALLLKAAGSAEYSGQVAPEKEGRCPVISWHQVAGWRGIGSMDRSVITEEWLICPIPHGADTFALRLSGESMQDPHGPISFYDGDIVFFDPARVASNNSFVAVKESDGPEATFKQLIVESNKEYLKALNPDWPNRIIPITEDTVICGVAICKYRPCSVQEYSTRRVDEDASQGR